MAENFEQLIWSTGMSDLNEVEQALQVLVKAGMPKEKENYSVAL